MVAVVVAKKSILLSSLSIIDSLEAEKKIGQCATCSARGRLLGVFFAAASRAKERHLKGSVQNSANSFLSRFSCSLSDFVLRVFRFLFESDSRRESAKPQNVLFNVGGGLIFGEHHACQNLIKNSSQRPNVDALVVAEHVCCCEKLWSAVAALDAALGGLLDRLFFVGGQSTD